MDLEQIELHYANDGHTRTCPACGDPFHPHKLVCARCGRYRPSMFGEELTKEQELRRLQPVQIENGELTIRGYYGPGPSERLRVASSDSDGGGS